MIKKREKLVMVFFTCINILFATEYDNLMKLYNSVTPIGGASISCIEKYGEPEKKEIKKAKEFFPWMNEDDIFIFYYYKNAKFIFFVGNEGKDFTFSWEIISNFSLFSSLLFTNMSMAEVKKTFGNKHNMMDMYKIKGNIITYGLNEGEIGFEIINNKLVRVFFSFGE